MSRNPSCRTILALALLMFGLVAACASSGYVSGPAEVHGLVVLGDRSSGVRIRAWVGPPTDPVLVDVPGTGDVAAMAVDTNGRIAATTEAGPLLRISAPVSSYSKDVSVAWHDISILTDDGFRVEGPVDQPAWDPAGTRVALIEGDVLGSQSITVVGIDGALSAPEGATSWRVALPSSEIAFGLAWVDNSTVAVALHPAAVSTAPEVDVAPRTLLLDVDARTLFDGPRSRLLAASVDGQIVLTTPSTLPRPIHIQAADAWINGGDPILATIEEPGGVQGVLGYAFDAEGVRLAVEWRRVSDGLGFVAVYEAATDWKESASTSPADWLAPTAVGWLP